MQLIFHIYFNFVGIYYGPCFKIFDIIMFVYVQIFTIYLFVIFGFGETVGFTFLLMTNYYAGRQLKLFSYWINILPAFSRFPRDHRQPQPREIKRK